MFNTKKKKLIWIIVTVILAAACVAFLAVSSLDEIVSTEVTEIEMGASSRYYLITHTFKNGKTVDVSVHCDDIMLDENVHLLHIHAEKDSTWSPNERLSSASYNLSDLSFAAHIEDKDGGRVLCLHCCGEGKQGATAQIFANHDLYGNSKATLAGSAEGDYIYAHYVIQGDFELSDLEISYDLNGKGTRLGSRFENQKTTIEIGKKAMPYVGESAEE